MSLFPAYMSDVWKCYEQMAREDREAVDPMLVSVDPDICHESVLPFLAWESGVYKYLIEGSDTRKMVKAAMASSIYAGTVMSLRERVKSALAEAEVKEWFEYFGDPYHFRVRIFDSYQAITPDIASKLEEFIAASKNARSKLDEIMVGYSFQSGVFMNHASMSELCVTAICEEVPL